MYYNVICKIKRRIGLFSNCFTPFVLSDIGALHVLHYARLPPCISKVINDINSFKSKFSKALHFFVFVTHVHREI